MIGDWIRLCRQVPRPFRQLRCCGCQRCRATVQHSTGVSRKATCRAALTSLGLEKRKAVAATVCLNAKQFFGENINPCDSKAESLQWEQSVWCMKMPPKSNNTNPQNKMGRPQTRAVAAASEADIRSPEGSISEQETAILSVNNGSANTTTITPEIHFAKSGPSEGAVPKIPGMFKKKNLPKGDAPYLKLF